MNTYQTNAQQSDSYQTDFELHRYKARPYQTDSLMNTYQTYP